MSDGSDLESECSEVEDFVETELEEFDELVGDEDDSSQCSASEEKYVARNGSIWYPTRSSSNLSFDGDKQPSLTAYSDGIKSPKDAFQLLLTPSVVDTIIHFTNKHAEGDENWTELSQDEFWGFISELIVIGLQKSRKRSISSLWSTDYFIRVPFYSTVMARDRFSNILRHIRFDDPQTRTTKIAETGDKFMALRDVFEKLRENSMKAYQPSATVMIDECLIPFRGRCGFKVYTPSKPGKYGMKLWTAADSVNSYAYNMQVYFGGSHLLSKNRQDIQPSDDHPPTSSAASRPVTSRDVKQAKRVVLDMVEGLEGSNRDITTDNLFTSGELDDDLLELGLFLTGTMRKNRAEVPAEFLPNKHRKEKSSLIGYSGEKMLTSYVTGKNKAVIFLTTNPTLQTKPLDGVKSDVNLYYNKKKAGVDILDKITREFSLTKPSNRWPYTCFSNLVEIMLHNAFILFTLKYPEWEKGNHRRRETFLRILAYQLAKQQVLSRSSKDVSKHVPSTLKQDMQQFIECADKLENEMKKKTDQLQRVRRT